MEGFGFQKFIDKVWKDPKLLSSSGSFEGAGGGRGLGVAAALSSSSSSDQSGILLNRPPRQVVSMWTCSKLCAFFFVAGVVAGYTLKRRVRRWAARVLRRMKDD